MTNFKEASFFVRDGVTYYLKDERAREMLAELTASSEEKYGPDNPPPYPVTSVNGQTGAVTVPTVTLPLAVSEGGTGATTAASAKVNLGLSRDATQNFRVSAPSSSSTQFLLLSTVVVTQGHPLYGKELQVYFTNDSLYVWNNTDRQVVWRTPSMSSSTTVWPVAQGGTGASTVAAARSNLNVPSVSDLTAAQSYTINGVNFIFRRYGKIVVCTTSGTLTNAVSTSAYMGNVQVAEIYRPISTEIRYIQATALKTIQYNLNADGWFNVGYSSESIPAGSPLRGTLVYIAAG